jgi:SPP1 gp7 family putative phage head morphogenesis protein
MAAKPPIGFTVDREARTVTAEIRYDRQYGSNVPTNGLIAPEDTLSVGTYKQMMRDETIRQNHEFIAFSVLSRIGEYHHDDKRVKEFVLKNFEDMRGSIYDAFREQLQGIPYGYSIGEPVYRLDGRATMLTKVDYYDPEGIEFRVITKKEAEEGLGLSGDLHPEFGIKQQGNGSTNYIPPAKALVYVPDKRWGNWYGNPTLRGAYKWWSFTENVPKWYAISLERYSIPILKATVSKELYDQTITVGGVTYGPSEERTILELAVKILDDIYGGRSVAVPVGMEIDQITSNAQISADFRGAIDFANKNKNRAQLVPDLLASQGQGTGTYAMANAHQDFYFQLIDWRVTQVTELMLDGPVRFLIETNFGQLGDWGVFQRRKPGQKQVEVEASVVEMLTDKGYLDPAVHGELVRQRLEFEEATAKPDSKPEPVLPRARQEEPEDEDTDEDERETPKLADDDAGDDLPEEVKPLLKLHKTLEEKAVADFMTITRKQAEALVRLAARINPGDIPDLQMPNAREFRRAWVDHLLEVYRAFRRQGIASLPAKERPPVTEVARPLAETLKRKGYVIADGISDDLKQMAKETLLRGFEQGKSTAEMVFDLQQGFKPYTDRPDVQEAGFQQASRLTERVRTAFTDVANDARLDVSKEASNVVAYRYRTIDDNRRSRICAGLSGMVVAVDDPIVKTIKPPNHHNCRSMLTYVLRGEEFELTPRDQVLRAAARIPDAFR